MTCEFCHHELTDLAHKCTTPCVKCGSPRTVVSEPGDRCRTYTEIKPCPNRSKHK
jgi:hypothetical protein